MSVAGVAASIQACLEIPVLIAGTPDNPVSEFVKSQLQLLPTRRKVGKQSFHEISHNSSVLHLDKLERLSQSVQRIIHATFDGRQRTIEHFTNFMELHSFILFEKQNCF